MSQGVVEQLARALLYEGYMLYPYRPSSVKNRSRFNFGVLYPPTYIVAQSGNDRSWLQTECLVEGSTDARVDIQVRFLHLQERTVARLQAPTGSATAAIEPVSHLEAGGQAYLPWQEAVEQEVHIADQRLGDLVEVVHREAFRFPYSNQREPVPQDGPAAGFVTRERQGVVGEVELSAAQCAEGLFRIRVKVRNRTDFQPGGNGSRDAALRYSLASAHTILRVAGASWVSLLDPPAAFFTMVEQCENIGCWPVLVGEAGQRDTMLASPIFIYDYPAIAPESAGDLFDGTEIDEILSLRIMTLTDAEKREMSGSDERARRILERTESLGAEEMMKMHGIMRPVGRTSEDQ